MFYSLSRGIICRRNGRGRRERERERTHRPVFYRRCSLGNNDGRTDGHNCASFFSFPCMARTTDDGMGKQITELSNPAAGSLSRFH